MRLPWVSRLAFDLVASERDRLRTQVDKLTDDLVRLQRVRHGLREIPRPLPKAEKQKPTPVSEDVKALIDGFDSEAVRDDLERQAQEMHGGGAPWPEVQKALELQLGLAGATT